MVSGEDSRVCHQPITKVKQFRLPSVIRAPQSTLVSTCPPFDRLEVPYRSTVQFTEDANPNFKLHQERVRLATVQYVRYSTVLYYRYRDGRFGDGACTVHSIEKPLDTTTCAT